jgi:zinc transport system substrate-binding protein
MPNSLRAAGLAAALASILGATALAGSAFAAPNVVTDFGPADSITARVMEGVGEPVQILPPGAEPHSYSLRPSEARELGAADLVVWVGPRMTPWLADPIATLATGARVLTLDALPGLTLLPIRATGPFEPDLHDHEAEGAEHDHAASEPEHDHDHDHEGESASGIDQHIWLDPENAVIFADAIAATLSEMDPANAEAYATNAKDFGAEMATLSAEVTETLAPVRGKPFIVFHDAYQYFEHRFDIPAAGSIALHDAEAPGAARVAEIRDRVRDDGVVCAFSEPQFPPKILATITEGTDARTAGLDPEGVGLTPGADLYPALIRNLATDLAACLE